MCILITKPRGAAFPPAAAIRNSINNNPNGFSLAYNEAGNVVTYKTMSARLFMAKYNKLVATLDPAVNAMIIHARIATHGAINRRNCHCWVSFPGSVHELAFAHNGILSVSARDGMTDSETFLRDYFEPSFMRGGWSNADFMIYRKIGTSKFAFIDRAGGIHQYGHFIHDGGCYYSNMSYTRHSFAACADPRMWNRKSTAI